MRYIPIDEVMSGMTPANNILDFKGNLLLNAGTPLNENLIQKLIDFNINGIYIQDEHTSSIEICSAISLEVRKMAILAITSQNIDACLTVSDVIVDELEESNSNQLDFTDLRSTDSLTTNHSINVAITCYNIGHNMGMSKDELRILVSAAILHDIGKMDISQDILYKPTRLSPDEYRIVQSHPMYSFNKISSRTDISSHIKSAVLSHHENVDGSGYPNKTTGRDQTIYTKILHIADVFDALVSKRPFKEPYSPLEASEYLMGACGIMFDKDIVDVFIKSVSIYPKGTHVNLSNGLSGYVYDNSDYHSLRPVVLLDDGGLFDLAHPSNLHISIKNNTTAMTANIMLSEKKRAAMTGLGKRPTILAVDDSKTNLFLIKEFLQADYDLTLASSGAEALAHIHNHGLPDLILMDIEMPDFNGLETAKAIDAMLNKHAPVIFVTSHRDRNTVMTCKSYGAAGYIIKPYSPTFIKAEIARIIYDLDGLGI